MLRPGEERVHSWDLWGRHGAGSHCPTASAQMSGGGSEIGVGTSGRNRPSTEAVSAKGIRRLEDSCPRAAGEIDLRVIFA